MALRLACTCAVPEADALTKFIAGRGFASSRDKCISVGAAVKVRTATDRKFGSMMWRYTSPYGDGGF